MSNEWRNYVSANNEPPSEMDAMEFGSFLYHSSSEISDDELVSLTVRDLNRLLKNSSYTRAEITRMKQRRRTLKNRGYAASCRNKRLEQKDELQLERSLIILDINCIKEDNRIIENELKKIRKNYESLRQFAINNNISIPPEFDMSCS